MLYLLKGITCSANVTCNTFFLCNEKVVKSNPRCYQENNIKNTRKIKITI